MIAAGLKAEKMGKGKVILKAAVWALLLGYGVHLVEYVAARPHKLQWDFAVYYRAAEVHRAGGDPYLAEGGPEPAVATDLPYLYPPLTLGFFELLTAFPYPVACRVWLGLKVAVLAGLILLWLRRFLPGARAAGFVAFAILAFDAAIFWDLKTGNTSLPEQALLWTAFLFYLRGRPVLFTVLLLLASFFKIAPAFFLLLLALRPDRRSRWCLAAGVGVLAGWVAANYLADPGLFRSFLAGLPPFTEPNDFNFGTLDLMHDLIDTRGAGPGVRALPFLAYGAVVAAVAVFLRGMRPAELARSVEGRRRLVFLACAVYAVILPRFMSYSFIVLLVPAYFAFAGAVAPVSPFLFLLCLIPVHNPLPDGPFLAKIAQYHPLLLAGLILVLLRDRLRREGPPVSGGSPPERRR